MTLERQQGGARNEARTLRAGPMPATGAPHSREVLVAGDTGALGTSLAGLLQTPDF